MTERSPEATLQRVEAARYAVLRRLSSAMRHQLVMHLQPIGMVAEVLTRRLQAPAPDLAQIGDSVARIQSYARTAVQASLDLVAWMAPDPAATQPLHVAVEEAMEMLRSNFGFRGFTLHDQTQAVTAPVGRAAMRMLLPAALLVLSDGGRAPADIVITAQADDVSARLRLSLAAGTGEAGSSDTLYRPLRWDELEALAAMDDVGLTRTPDGLQLTFNVLH